MKILACRLCMVVAAFGLFVVPVRGEEGGGTGASTPVMDNIKDECLLVAKNCSSDTVQERIERLTNELGRGTAVYTTDELRKLENELNEYKKEIQVLERDKG